MKKGIILSLGILLAGAPSFAQNAQDSDNPAQHRAEQRVEKMTQSLELNDDERTQLIDIYSEYYEERMNMDPDVDQPKEKSDELRDNAMERIIAVIGEDRYEAYSDERMEHKKEMDKRSQRVEQTEEADRIEEE